MLQRMMNRAAVSGKFTARNTMPVVGMYNQSIVLNIAPSTINNNET